MLVVIPNDWNGVWDQSPEVARLRNRADVLVGEPGLDLSEALRRADIVAGLRERTRFDAALLNTMPRLKLIAHIGGHAAPHIDLPLATARGVLVCFTEGAPSASPNGEFDEEAIVELTIGMMISLSRQFALQSDAIHAGEWPTSQGRLLKGKTLGIVGLGRLGTRVAEAAKFFGMTVISGSPTLTPERAAAVGVGYRSLEALFSEADIV
jgi:phosphoglycerate dehydrogenase-like enzyme